MSEKPSETWVRIDDMMVFFLEKQMVSSLTIHKYTIVYGAHSDNLLIFVSPYYYFCADWFIPGYWCAQKKSSFKKLQPYVYSNKIVPVVKKEIILKGWHQSTELGGAVESEFFLTSSNYFLYFTGKTSV